MSEGPNLTADNLRWDMCKNDFRVETASMGSLATVRWRASLFQREISVNTVLHQSPDIRLDRCEGNASDAGESLRDADDARLAVMFNRLRLTLKSIAVFREFPSV